METVNPMVVAEFRKAWGDKYPSYQPRFLAYCFATGADPDKEGIDDYREWINWLLYKFSPDGVIHDHAAFTDFIWEYVVKNLEPSRIILHFESQEVELK